MFRKCIRGMVHKDWYWSSALCIDGGRLILSMQSLHTHLFFILFIYISYSVLGLSVMENGRWLFCAYDGDEVTYIFRV